MAPTNSTARALILANPRARRAGGPHWRKAAVAELSRRYATDVEVPRSARDTTSLARAAAAAGVAVVVAGGGDGTINAVAEGLAGTSTALGILPLGTANDLAREYRVPTSLEAAARRIVEGEAHAVDLVQIGDRVFCGVGGLALVARAALAVTHFKGRSAVARRVADFLGRHVYRLSAAAALLARWRLDDTVRIAYREPESGMRKMLDTRASAVFVTNHRTLGGGLVLPIDSSPSDGVMEILYAPARSRHSLMLNFARLSTGASIPPGVLLPLRANEATITTGNDDAFVADGELLAEGRKFELRVLPKALRIIVGSSGFAVGEE
ncbi:MAG TPA: diacylglycerol kinase family protein [Gemmatimonadaceae bacterium]|nr:diacylglycerol kinase family protein [Gemmatimonadaceae bacterium]